VQNNILIKPLVVHLTVVSVYNYFTVF